MSLPQTPPPTFDLTVAPHPLRRDVFTGVVPAGCTLREMGAGGAVLAFVDGVLCADLDTAPRAGQVVLLKVVPQGGSDALRLVATLAVVVLSAYTGGAVAAAYGAGYGAAASAAVTLAGSLAVNALIPPTALSLDAPTAFQPFRAISRTSNRVALFEPIARLYGTDRIYPPYAALPVPVANGGQQDFLGLFCVGYRRMVIDPDSFRLGETPLASYEGAQFRIWDHVRDEALEQVFQFGASTDSDPGDLKEVPAVILRTTAPNTARVEIEFGGGPVGFFGEKRKDSVAVGITLEYRVAGSGGAWLRAAPSFVAGDGGVDLDYPSGLSMNRRVWGDFSPQPPGSVFGPAGYVQGTAGDVRTYTVSIGFSFVSPGQYELRISRLPAVRYNPENQVDYSNSDGAKTRQQISLIRLRYLSAGTAGNPLADLDPRFAYVALRLRASDQLSGALDDFNLVATGVCAGWDGSAYVDQPTSSPAWAFRDILLGSANARPVLPSKLDEITLRQWAADCAAEVPPREFNGTFDGLVSVFEALKSVASAGRAAFSIRDGRYSVVRDQPGLTPVQLFTPRNLWDFEAGKRYLRLPHALKMKFRDRDAGWMASERIVYADGFSLDGSGGTTVATQFEQITLFGTTHRDLVYRDARYHQAVAALRPETFSWQTAIEHLVCQRGDVVRVQHDALLVGLAAARITARTANTVTLDETVRIESGPAYGLSIRTESGSTLIVGVTALAGPATVLTVTGGVPAAVAVGNLAAFGEMGSISFEALVTAIEPGPDLTARITAVPYSSPAVHSAETGPIPPYDPLVTAPQLRPPAPVILNIDSSAEVGTRNSDGTFAPRIFVSYGFPASDALVTEIEAELRADTTANWTGSGRRPNRGTVTFDLLDDATEFDLRLRGRSERGTPGPWTTQLAYMLESARVEGEPGLSLIEQIDSPSSPNHDLSTVIATVVPPPDPRYSHALIDYRRDDAIAWFVIGNTDASQQARVVLHRDGTTYVFRARAVNAGGLVTDFGATASLTLSAETGLPPDDPDVDAPTDAGLDVGPLNIQGKPAAAGAFDGPDLVIQWPAVIPPPGQTLRDYRYQIVDPTTLQVMTHRYGVGQQFTYTLADNQRDSLRLGYAGPLRALRVEMIARSAQGRVSASERIKTVDNPAPALPPDFLHGAVDNTLVLRFSRPADGDYVGARVFLSTVTGFTPGPASLVYDGAETMPIVIQNLAFATPYFYRIELLDRFGSGGVSAEYTSTTFDVPGTDTVPPTVPGVPVLSSAVESAQLFTIARLEAAWAPSTDASTQWFYELEVWTDPAHRQTRSTPFASDTINNVRAGALYSARVRAVDYSGNASAWSAVATHTIAGDSTAPGLATAATATGGLDKVVVEWTNPSDADFLVMRVYRGTSAGFAANASSLRTETRSTLYVDAEVAAGSSYYYRLAAVDVAGNVGPLTADIGPAAPNTITSINVGNYIADAALTAPKLNVLFGGGNALSNSSFETDTDGNGLADGWITQISGAGSNGALVTTLVPAVAPFGALAQQLFVPALTGTARQVEMRVAGPWAAGLRAVFSVYLSGTPGLRCRLFFGYTGGAALNTQTADFALTATPTRYMLTIGPGPAGTTGFLARVRCFGEAVGFDATLIADNMQIEHGEVASAYAPRPDEILAGSITGPMLGNAILTTAKFAAGLTPVEIVAALPASGNFDGRTVFLTTDKKLYRYSVTAAAFTAAVPTTDLSGQITTPQISAGAITSTQIGDDAVTTPKIAAGAVTADEIAAGAIVAGKIAANSITAAEIAANTLTAGQIAANTLTAGQIAAGAITATEIAANAITADAIAAGAITAGKIAAGAVVAGKIAAGVITSTEIAAGTIATSRLIVGDFGNLLENADYELGASGWSGAWTIDNDPATARNGSWRARGSTAQTLQNDARVRCQAGDTFFGSAWMRFETAGGGVGVRVEVGFLDAAGALIGAWAAGTTVGVAVVAYTSSTVTATAPAGATFASLRLAFIGGSVGTVFADQAFLGRVNGSALIGDAAITSAKIALLSVDNARIVDGTIQNAKIASLDAAKITTGFLAAARIQAGTLTADKISVAALSAISADIGSITAGTLTGALVRTAAAGARAELSSATGLTTLNSGGSLTARLNVDGSGYLGLNPGAIQWTSAGAVSIPGSLTLSGTLTMTAGAIQAGKAAYASTVAGYWLGYDSGLARFHIGNASRSLQWDGSSLTVQGMIQTAASGQRLVIDPAGSANALMVYDAAGAITTRIGYGDAGSGLDSYAIRTTATAVTGQINGAAITSDNGLALFLRNSTAAASTLLATNNSTGVNPVCISAGANSSGSGTAVSAAGGSSSGVGVNASGFTGVLGSGNSATGYGVDGLGAYGVRCRQQSAAIGGAAVLQPAGSSTAAPTHTALVGTLCPRFSGPGGALQLWLQNAGGAGGSGSTWATL